MIDNYSPNDTRKKTHEVHGGSNLAAKRKKTNSLDLHFEKHIRFKRLCSNSAAKKKKTLN